MTDTNTLELPSEFDAIVKLRPGEPYFGLIGRDRLAPDLVLRWADLNRRRALKDFEDRKIDEDKLERELRQSTDAEKIAWAMQDYKAGVQEIAAPAEEQKVTYSGNILPEETRLRDAEQAARGKIRAAVNNTVSVLTDAIPYLMHGTDRCRAQALIEDLKRGADELSVKPRLPLPKPGGVVAASE